ncbi:hypothetical protein [Heliophilum fasciatum]|uniref:Uncharacterized protein n=1 Tax=Heliophilum fasciatum TaxID=35700 RepID=A0A4R2RPT9_9FIRM|nr:hypothetical protein [Heliophilum fasciatum]MCW2277768.1 hypothetical protein [Heliophilum fasciatum]TCP64739.1 hypothetical protein EDD73_10892 [Heliophilum fasciatum]
MAYIHAYIDQVPPKTRERVDEFLEKGYSLVKTDGYTGSNNEYAMFDVYLNNLAAGMCILVSSGTDDTPEVKHLTIYDIEVFAKALGMLR